MYSGYSRTRAYFGGSYILAELYQKLYSHRKGIDRNTGIHQLGHQHIRIQLPGLELSHNHAQVTQGVL